MSDSIYPGITGVRLPLNDTDAMASRRIESKDTVEGTNGDTVEQVSMSLPIYEDTKSFVDNIIKMKW